MKLTLCELLNPWAALRKAKLDNDILRRDRALMARELQQALRNDRRGRNGRFIKATPPECKCDPSTWVDANRTQICNAYEEDGNRVCLTCMHDRLCHTHI